MGARFNYPETSMNWQEFFYMGGYAFEVWTCWGLSFLVMAAFVIFSKLSNAKIRKQIAREITREQQFK